jgi:hypothetical protein
MKAQTLHRRRWHALDDGVLAYGLALLRTLWLWPLLHLAALGIFANGRDFLAPWLIFALLAGGTLAAQVAALLTGSQATHRTAPRTSTLGAVLVVLCGLAAILVAVHLGLGSGRAALALAQLPAALREQPGRAVATLALAGGLWWWGLLAGRETVAYDMLSRNFLIGLAGLLFVLGLNSSAQFIPRSALLALLLAYLATGLFLLALASIQATRRYERATGDHDLALPSHWWATVVTVVVTLLLAALILSWLFVPETFERLAAAVAAILALVGQLVAWLILALSYPLFMLLEWLARMVPAIPWDGRMPELLPPPGSTEQLRDLRGEGGAPIDPTAWWIGAGVLALAAIAFLFVLAVRHYRTAPDEDDVAETHEGILTVDLLKTQLSALLRRRRATSPAVAPYLPLAGDDPATRIRRTYQQLLKWAAGNGLARAPGMTPDHYRDLLASAYPAHSAGFATITAAYCLARYSPVPIPEAEVARVTAAWQQILAGTAVPGPNAKETS